MLALQGGQLAQVYYRGRITNPGKVKVQCLVRKAREFKAVRKHVAHGQNHDTTEISKWAKSLCREA